jgi:outer membrane protein
MFLRTGLRPLVVCSALFVLTHAASAQSKVAVVNLQRAVFECAEIQKADKDMQAKFKPRQDEIDQLNREIGALAQQLQNGAGKLTAQAESDLTAQGQTKQRQVQRKTDDLNADATAYRNEILSKSSNKMTEVVKKLAEEKGLDLIVDTATTLYFKSALDLTDDAIKAYNKAYPVTAAAPSK